MNKPIRLFVSFSGICGSRDPNLPNDPNDFFCFGTTPEAIPVVFKKYDIPQETQLHLLWVFGKAHQDNRLVYRTCASGDDGYYDQFNRLLALLGARLGRSLPDWQVSHPKASWNIPEMKDYFRSAAPEVSVCEKVS